MADIKRDIEAGLDRVLADPMIRDVVTRRTGSNNLATTRNAVSDELITNGMVLEVRGLLGKPKPPDALWTQAFQMFSATPPPPRSDPLRDPLLRNAVAEVAATHYVQHKHANWKPREEHRKHQHQLIDEEVSLRVAESVEQARSETEATVSGRLRDSSRYLPLIRDARNALRAVGKAHVLDDAMDSAARWAVGQVNWKQLESTMSVDFARLVKQDEFQAGCPEKQKVLMRQAVKSSLTRDFDAMFPGTIHLGNIDISVPAKVNPVNRVIDPLGIVRPVSDVRIYRELGSIDLWPESAKAALIDRIANEVSSRAGTGQQTLTTTAPTANQADGVAATLNDIDAPSLPFAERTWREWKAAWMPKSTRDK